MRRASYSQMSPRSLAELIFEVALFGSRDSSEPTVRAIESLLVQHAYGEAERPVTASRPYAGPFGEQLED